MSSSRFTNDVWILGATGRVGRAVAARLVESNVFPVLVGRDRERLSQLAASLSKELRTIVAAASVPFGELVAAQRASGASNVLAASSEIPTGPAVRAILPFAIVLSHIRPLRTFAKRRLARLHISSRKRPREHSWGHASVQWPDGTDQEGWLRTGDAMAFTTTVAATVAEKLLADQGQPGAYTPGTLFGPELAEAAGGTFLIAPTPRKDY
jgi:short subunit dehydrogenase-like uncharacterized protein